jgi:acyl dehydratase
MKPGDKLTWERTFTEADIRAFTQLSGDTGEHHLAPDAHGRVMVQGLLTATLPTKLGGDINFIAREMHFSFERAVYAGDTVRIELTLTQVQKLESTTLLEADWVCTNQHDRVVMTGSTSGVIRRT